MTPRDLEAACRRLPFFPLPRVVLFPGALLPLHIFEPRYRQMIGDALAGDGAIAMALPLPTADPAAFEPPVHEIAGLGWIKAHERMPDGRYAILLEGAARVRLHELPRETFPKDTLYRTARAEVLAEPAAPHLNVQVALSLATQIATRVRKHEPRFELDLPAKAVPPGALCDRLANRLVRDTAKRQALLEALDPAVRLALLEGALAELLNELGSIGGAGGPGPS